MLSQVINVNKNDTVVGKEYEDKDVSDESSYPAACATAWAIRYKGAAIPDVKGRDPRVSSEGMTNVSACLLYTSRCV